MAFGSILREAYPPPTVGRAPYDGNPSVPSTPLRLPSIDEVSLNVVEIFYDFSLLRLPIPFYHRPAPLPFLLPWPYLSPLLQRD